MNFGYFRTLLLGTALAILSLGVTLAVSGCILSPAFAQVPENIRQGTVRSTKGTLLTQVWVQELGTWRGRPTEANGQFEFRAGKPATLLFFKDGFRPQVRVTSGSEGLDGISVVLEPDAGAVLTLRSCRRQLGLLLEIEPARIRGLHLRRGFPLEYSSYEATYKHGSSMAYISSSTGIHVGGLTPKPNWVSGLFSFAVSSLKCGGEQWFDLRGTTDTGLESRWVGKAGSHVEYSKVPAPVARVFDKAIDSGCCH